MSERSLLLDTCALIWLAAAAPELSTRSRTAIDAADMVWVSAISAWEISLKVAHKTLELPMPPEEWLTKTLDHHRLSLAALGGSRPTRCRGTIAIRPTASSSPRLARWGQP